MSGSGLRALITTPGGDIVLGQAGNRNLYVLSDPDLIAELYTRFAARRITITRNNEKQADTLEGAVILEKHLTLDRGRPLRLTCP